MFRSAAFVRYDATPSGRESSTGAHADPLAGGVHIHDRLVVDPRLIRDGYPDADRTTDRCEPPPHRRRIPDASRPLRLERPTTVPAQPPTMSSGTPDGEGEAAEEVSARETHRLQLIS
jgi:hypothetical protein